MKSYRCLQFTTLANHHTYNTQKVKTIEMAPNVPTTLDAPLGPVHDHTTPRSYPPATAQRVMRDQPCGQARTFGRLWRFCTPDQRVAWVLGGKSGGVAGGPELPE